MEEIGFKVNEIVTSRDTAVRYVYVHLKKKARAEELDRAIQTLASRGVKGTEIFGYKTVDGNTPSVSEHLEDHPGFQTLVQHERVRCSEFHRLTASDINPHADFGYNRLKHKLLAKQSSDSAAGSRGPYTTGASASGGEGGSGGYGTTGHNEEHVPPPRTEESAENKRRRTESPDDGVKNMISLDVMTATVSAAMSSAVTSVFNSTGVDRNKEREDARSYVQMEQQRRERAERQLHEVECRMAQRLVDERKNVQEEAAVKYRELEVKFQEMKVFVLYILILM